VSLHGASHSPSSSFGTGAPKRSAFPQAAFDKLRCVLSTRSGGIPTVQRCSP